MGEGAPFGLIEIVLGFGAILGWAAWETVRTRRELARMKRDAEPPPER